MAKNDIWTCKDGRKMKMCEMSDTHLKRSINYFSCSKVSSDNRCRLLMKEQERRDKLTPDDPINTRFEILDL